MPKMLVLTMEMMVVLMRMGIVVQTTSFSFVAGSVVSVPMLSCLSL